MAVCNFEAVSSLWDGRAYKQSHRCREGKTFPLLCFPETGAPPVTAQASSNCSAQRTVPTETLSSGSCGWNQEINRLCSAQEITFLLYLHAHSLSFGKPCCDMTDKGAYMTIFSHGYGEWGCSPKEASQALPQPPFFLYCQPSLIHSSSSAKPTSTAFPSTGLPFTTFFLEGTWACASW